MQTPALHTWSLPQLALSVHPVSQVAAAPPHTYGAHEGAPLAPAPRFVHVPTEPLRLHASHAPAHAVSQHTPSTHSPVAHAFAAVQLAPPACLGTHAPFTQYVEAVHCASPVHDVGHEAAPAQTKGAQLDGVPLGATVHCPTVPTWLHASHAPSHRESQHTPSTHWPLTHCFAAVHEKPSTNRP